MLVYYTIFVDVQEKIHRWEEQSKELISNFLVMFGGPSIEQVTNNNTSVVKLFFF